MIRTHDMRRLMDMIERLWPAMAMVILFAGAEVLIVTLLAESIEAVIALASYLRAWRGPHTLLGLSSAAMEWLTTTVVQRRLGSVGIPLALVSMLLCGLGWVAAMFVSLRAVELSPAATRSVVVCCALPLIVTIILRTGWAKYE